MNICLWASFINVAHKNIFFSLALSLSLSLSLSFFFLSPSIFLSLSLSSSHPLPHKHPVLSLVLILLTALWPKLWFISYSQFPSINRWASLQYAATFIFFKAKSFFYHFFNAKCAVKMWTPFSGLNISFRPQASIYLQWKHYDPVGANKYQYKPLIKMLKICQ